MGDASKLVSDKLSFIYNKKNVRQINKLYLGMIFRDRDVLAMGYEQGVTCEHNNHYINYILKKHNSLDPAVAPHKRKPYITRLGKNVVLTLFLAQSLLIFT